MGVDQNQNKIEDAITCWPPTSKGAPTPIVSPGGWEGYGFYSPGLVCPAGYTSACTATEGGHSDWDVQFSMTQGETAVGCCPRYVYDQFRTQRWAEVPNMPSADEILIAADSGVRTIPYARIRSVEERQQRATMSRCPNVSGIETLSPASKYQQRSFRTPYPRPPQVHTA